MINILILALEEVATIHSHFFHSRTHLIIELDIYYPNFCFPVAKLSGDSKLVKWSGKTDGTLEQIVLKMVCFILHLDSLGLHFSHRCRSTIQYI